MYSTQIEAMIPDKPPFIAVERESDMTWQQKEQFGPAVKADARKAKVVHWQPLSLETIQDPATTSTIGNGEAKLTVTNQQAQIPTANRQAKLPVTNSRKQHRRGKAAASPLRQLTSPPASEPLLLASTHESASTPQKPSRKSFKPRHKNKSSAKDKKMSEVPDRAYVPPHLRNRANNANAQVKKVETPVANASSIVSVNSKAEHADKLHSSPNCASNTSNLPPSPPSTSGEPNPWSEKHGHAEKSTPVLGSPRTDMPQEVYKAEDGVWTGWDAPKSDISSSAPKKENPRWPRTRAPPKKHVWVKASDIKALPSDSSSDGGVTCNSNSNGDPDYDVKKLMDWNGDWLPPPEQWSARKGHIARHLGSSIEQWINGHDEICLKAIPVEDDTLGFSPPEGDCKEVVPRYWIVSSIEQDSLGAFWKSMPTRQPAALSDVSAHPPFWERYATESSHYIEEISVPDALIDRTDPDNFLPGIDLLVSADVRIQRMFDQRAHAQRRTLARQRRPVREFLPPAEPLPDRRIQPKSNVYFRPVQPADVGGITEIYNHYVEATIYANEFEARSRKQIANRIDAIIKAGLPVLVAVARGNQPKGPQGYVNEKIVGYASLDDYCDQSSMYRYTFELEIYVHPGYLCQNIASCLLDRLLEMANTGYNACGGYDYRNDFEYLKTGPSRVIKIIMLTVHKEHDEKHEKTTDYLKRFKFIRSGHIPQIGFKLGKTVDAHFYRHVTTETIEASGRPTVSLERD